MTGPYERLITPTENWMNSVFHPPGNNPFNLPPLPQSHYNPSPLKETQDKSITLTPQKITRRHEYSLPPEVYTPEQYSIHEDDPTTAKPPIPSHNTADVVQNLQPYLNDVESWSSSRFCEQWPSKDSAVNEEESTQLQSLESSTMQAKYVPLTSTTRSTKSKPQVTVGKDRPLRLKTSFASERNLTADSRRSSNIEMRLKRFRYGDPKPPEQRRKEQTRLPTPSSTPSVHYPPPSTESKQRSFTNTKASTPRPDTSQRDKSESILPNFSRISSTSHSSSPVVSQLKPPIPPKKPDSPEAADITLSELHTRLDKLLQESSAAVSSPERSSYHTPTDKSSSLEFKVSSIDTTESSEFEMSKIENFDTTGKSDENEQPRRTVWQKENLPPVGVHFSPPKIHHDDDILYQWRLRRKLETARDNVTKNMEQQRIYGTPAPSYQNQPEKPFSPQIIHRPTQYGGAYQPQSVPDHPPFQHRTTCNCQPSGQTSYLPPPTNDGVGTTHHGRKITMDTKTEMINVAVGETVMVTSETQTGRSLILSDEEPTAGRGSYEPKRDTEVLRRSASVSSIPHTTTPASSVSFHRVKIVQAELENSPQASKGSPQVKNASPASSKTEITTVWSSTDQNKRSEDDRSPASSIKTSDQRFASDSENFSPTANVVTQVVGARLFNSSQTPLSTSRIAKLKEKKEKKRSNKKEPSISEHLDGSYTSSPLPTEEQPSLKQGSGTSIGGSESKLKKDSSPSRPETPSISSKEDDQRTTESSKQSLEPAEQANQENEASFDPEEMFDRLLDDIAGDPGDFLDDPVLKTLRDQRDQFLQEFRSIQERIENISSYETPQKE